jgi:hypothetical protein
MSKIRRITAVLAGLVGGALALGAALAVLADRMRATRRVRASA